MLKKLWIFGLIVLLLCGCETKPAFETVSDSCLTAAKQERSLSLVLPEEAVQPVLQCEEAGKLYFCQGYTLSIQTMAGEDISETMRVLTGYEKDILDPIMTREKDHIRYTCAWSSAGEDGQKVSRAVILDDGDYHYAVTVMADEEKAGQLRKTWDTLLSGVDFKHID